MLLVDPQKAASIRPATNFHPSLGWYPSDAHTEPETAQDLPSGSGAYKGKRKRGRKVLLPHLCTHTK